MRKTLGRAASTIASLLVIALILPQLSVFAYDLSAETCDDVRDVIVVLSKDADREAVGREIEKYVVDKDEIREYSLFFDGFGISIASHGNTIDALCAIDGVESVFENTEYEPLSASESDELVRIVYDESVTPDDDPTRGAGAVIAVIDDGFDVRHPSMKLGNSEDLRITSENINEFIYYSRARRLFNYSTIKYVYKNEKIPFAFDYADRDTNVYASSSHGTAMASIAAGYMSDGSFSGAAPSAQVLAMKVYSDRSSTAKTSDVICALEDAYLMGADSVCLSLGAPCGYSSDGAYGEVIEQVIEKLCDAEITVVCAAGNDSALGEGSIFDEYYGYFEPLTNLVDSGTVNTPSTVPSALSVASADAYVGRARAFMMCESGKYIPYSDSNASADTTGGVSFAQYFDGETLEYLALDGVGKLEDFEGLDLDGKVALIGRGELPFVEKINNAAACGAVAVIVYDSEKSTTPSIRTAIILDGASIPAIFISYSDGEAMRNAEDKRIVTDKNVVYVTNAGITPSPSDFSSRGPTPTLEIKPEVAASGSDVTAAGMNSGFISMSGTSASAAYAAGVAARVAVTAARTDTGKGVDVKTVLMNTSVPMANIDDGRYKYYSVTLQGAGYISPTAAEAACVTVSGTDGGKVELGNDIGKEFDIPLTLENISEKEQTLSLSAVIGTESYETVTLGELCDAKDPFYRTNGNYLYEYLGKSEEDTVGFVGDFIAEFEKASIKYEGNEINRAADGDGCTVTIAPGEKLDLTLHVSLDEDEMRELEAIYENGMYVQGYVFVENEISYSLPFLGFYGDFGSLSPFDTSDREGAGAFGGVYLYTYYEGEYKDYTVRLGTNSDVEVTRKHPITFDKLNVISSVADHAEGAVFMHVSLVRSVRSLSVEVFDEKGEAVGEKIQMNDLAKAYLDKGTVNSYSFKIWDSRDAVNPDCIYDDGRYTCKLTAVDAFGNEFYCEKEFAIDSEKPTLVSFDIVNDDGESTLELTVEDNTYVGRVEAYTFNGIKLDALSDTSPNDEALFDAGTGDSFTVSFDVTDMAGQYVYVKIYDIASNYDLVRIKL